MDGGIPTRLVLGTTPAPQWAQRPCYSPSVAPFTSSPPTLSPARTDPWKADAARRRHRAREHDRIECMRLAPLAAIGSSYASIH